MPESLKEMKERLAREEAAQKRGNLPDNRGLDLRCWAEPAPAGETVAEKMAKLKQLEQLEQQVNSS